jgi:hypothetical protein
VVDLNPCQRIPPGAPNPCFRARRFVWNIGVQHPSLCSDWGVGAWRALRSRRARHSSGFGAMELDCGQFQV